MGLYRATGIVLRTYKLGEADRIIVFLTRERGKVRAVAKGVRKTRSKFGSRLEPTHNVGLQLHEGRSDLHIVTQVESLDHFRVIREDLSRLTKAVAMLEAIDQVAREDEPSIRLYDMLLGALRSLTDNDAALLVPGFFFKLLMAEGSQPRVDACVSCGKTEGLVSFSESEGGLTCRDCRRGVPVSPEAVEHLQQILGGRLADALTAPESPATHETSRLATKSLEFFLERRLRSTGVLDS